MKVHNDTVTSSPAQASGKNTTIAGDDPFDFSDLQSKIMKATEHLAHALSQLRAGGRFNPEKIEELKVSIKGSGDGAKASLVKVKDLAQVVAKGRNVSVICHEEDVRDPFLSHFLDLES